MDSELNTLLENTCFYISKNITSSTFFLVFKIVESLQCILKSLHLQFITSAAPQAREFYFNLVKVIIL